MFFSSLSFFFFFNDTATTEIYTLSLHDALPIWWCDVRSAHAGVRRAQERGGEVGEPMLVGMRVVIDIGDDLTARCLQTRSEEHTSELQSRLHLVCRLLLEKKKKHKTTYINRCIV